MINLTLEKTLTALLAYMFVCILVSSSPLFGILGYEFSVVIATVNYFMAGIFLIWSYDDSFSKSPIRTYIRYTLSFLVLSLIPLAFMTVKGLFVTNCNYPKGLVFYTIISEISLILGTSVGFFAASFKLKRILSSILFLCLSVIILLKLPYDLIYTPKVDSYNHILGFFAGPIYDEIVRITPALIFYRFYTLVLSGLFLITGSIIVTYFHGRKNSLKFYKASFCALIFLFLLFNIFSAPLGFGRSSGYIQKKLGFHSATEHFNYYYSKESKHLIKTIGDEFEFRFHQNSRFLNMDYESKIGVYIYPNSKSQKSLMGSGGIFISKPSMNQIHMRLASPFRLPIKHEMIHVMASKFSLPIIKISPRIALLEGLATAAEGYRGGMTFDQYSSALFKLKLAPDIREIMGLGFWKEQAARAYYLSASFVQYLIDSYGVEKLKLAYRGNSFVDTYGLSLEVLAERWEKKVKAIELTEAQIAESEAIFKPKGILEKRCAHEVAFLLRKAHDLSEESFKKKIRHIQRAHYLSGESYRTYRALMRVHFMNRSCMEALKIAEDILKKSKLQFYKSSAMKIKAGCSAIKDKKEEALGFLKNVYIYETRERSLLENLLIENLIENGVESDLIEGYYFAGRARKIIILREILENNAAVPSELTFTIRFVLGAFYYDEGKYRDSSALLSFIVDEPWPEKLEEYLFKLLGKTYYLNGQFSKAGDTFKRLKARFKPAGILLYADEWLERIDFARERTKGNP